MLSKRMPFGAFGEARELVDEAEAILRAAGGVLRPKKDKSGTERPPPGPAHDRSGGGGDSFFRALTATPPAVRCATSPRGFAGAKDGHILVSSRIAEAVEAVVKLDDLGELELGVFAVQLWRSTSCRTPA
jgi:hypothetical protein